MLRLDRLLTLRLFNPLICAGVMHRNNGIPILMYHSISEDLERASHPYYQTTTAPSTFAKHMRFLYDHNYIVLSLQEAVGRLKDRSAVTEKTVVLTFDDGFEDFHGKAFPVLHRYGFPSTVFLATDFIDNQKLEFKGKKCLSWDQVRELHGCGVVFGSHTKTHPRLVKLNEHDLMVELQESKKRLESELGPSIECFSYPYAFPEEHRRFVRELRKSLASTGYTCGVTTKIGISQAAEDPLFLSRIPMNDLDDIDLLRAKLDGAYNWTHGVQRVGKLAKAMKN